jgi:Protein of unknown function (DUF1614)
VPCPTTSSTSSACAMPFLPSTISRGTIVAVNGGGAVIPTLTSIFLLIKRELWVKGLLATVIVALVIHWMADPVPGLGIAVPIFMPVVVTAIVAMILSREDSAPLAYIAGSLGTLIGADLTNLDKVRGLGAPVALIGGAGRHISDWHSRRAVGESLRAPASASGRTALRLKRSPTCGLAWCNSSNPILIADAADLSIREIYLDHVF